MPALSAIREGFAVARVLLTYAHKLLLDRPCACNGTGLDRAGGYCRTCDRGGARADLDRVLTLQTEPERYLESVRGLGVVVPYADAQATMRKRRLGCWISGHYSASSVVVGGVERELRYWERPYCRRCGVWLVRTPFPGWVVDPDQRSRASASACP